MITLDDATHKGTLGAAARERARVRAHLAGAERTARLRGVRLDPLAALCRSLLLRELGRYRRRGVFPRNPGHARKAIPQFIDAHGTRCAVAHLMEISGQGELVRHIARAENDASVRALARLPELRAWLAAAGLSRDEAARIQPSYCYYYEADACFCRTEWDIGVSGPSSVTGVAVGSIVALDDQSIRIRVDRIDGTLPGLAVGDEREVARAVSPVGTPESIGVGSQLLFAQGDQASSTDAGGPTLVRVQRQLTIDGDSVTCDFNGATARRPVSVDTAIEAMLAMDGSCVGVLANDDSAWNEETCDSYDIAPDDGSGCSLTPVGTGALVAGELTSAALLIALLLYRRQRG